MELFSRLGKLALCCCSCSCVRDRSSGASDGSLTARLATHVTFVSTVLIGLEVDRHVSLLVDTHSLLSGGLLDRTAAADIVVVKFEYRSLVDVVLLVEICSAYLTLSRKQG